MGVWNRIPRSPRLESSSPSRLCSARLVRSPISHYERYVCNSRANGTDSCLASPPIAPEAKYPSHRQLRDLVACQRRILTPPRSLGRRIPSLRHLAVSL